MEDYLTYEIEIRGILEEVLDNYSVENISALLFELLLIEKDDTCLEKDYKKYVFLESFQDEIYTLEERNFISTVKRIFIYPSFYKRIRRGQIPCNIVAVDLKNSWESIKSGILFMKTFNKATYGFNIFIIRLSDGVHIGCRLYDKEEWKDCILSDTSDLEDIISEVASMQYDDDFISFYTCFLEIIEPKDNSQESFEDSVRIRRGVDIQYLNTITDVEKDLQRSTKFERESYIESFITKEKKTFWSDFLCCLEDLKDIKATKANTMEMLFEAEEIERIANEAYEKKEEIAQEEPQDFRVDLIDEIGVGELQGDPEELIKKLKEQKGIY